MFTGRSFHNLGAATAKLWHPNLRRAFGMISKSRISVSETECNFVAESSSSLEPNRAVL